MNVVIFFSLTILFTGVFFSTVVSADRDDDDDDDDRRGRFSFWNKRAAVDPLYKNECGSCHIAYPARFMSADGWQKIMTTLDDHFGDNAELDKQDETSILRYLEANSSRESRWGWGRNNGSLRISDNRYFQREHHEVPARAVGSNAKIKSFSNCMSCHRRADKGAFRESEISIPGFRSWGD